MSTPNLKPQGYQSNLGMPYFPMGIQGYDPTNIGYGQDIQSMQNGTYNYGQGYQTPTQDPSFTYGTPNYSGGYSPMSDPSSTKPFEAPNLPYGSIATGLFQLPFAWKAWNDAKKAVLPQFSQTAGAAKNLEQANQMATQGYTGSEKAAFMSKIGNDANVNYGRAKAMSGGQGSGAIYGVINGINTDAINNFAMGDAQLKRDNIRTRNVLESQNQDIQNQNTALGIDMYNKKQAAAAALTQSTIKNLASVGNLVGGFI